MGWTFFESMRGEVRATDGAWVHVDLALRCASRRMRAMVGGAPLELLGTATASPWAEGAACWGTLTVNPIAGVLRYEVAFDDDAGRRLTVTGQKDVRLRRGVEGYLHLPVVVREGVTEIARGALRFEIDDLPAFLASFRLDAPFSAAPSPPAPLDTASRAALGALAEVVIKPGQTVPAADAETVAGAERVLAYGPAGVGAGLRAALSALEHTTGFSRRPLAQRERWVGRVAQNTIGAGVVNALSMPVKAAHFARRDYLDRNGLPTWVTPVAEPDPRWLCQVTDAATLPESSRIDCDVVVVGTGAGGGPMAAALAEAGLAVLLVEEGPFARRQDFQGAPERRLLSWWRDGAMSVTVGNLPLLLPTGRVVGGSTTINSGTCYRTPDDVLRAWVAEGLPTDFAPSAFAPWLDQVEAELQVAPASPSTLGPIAGVVAKGAAAMGGTSGPLRRNAPGCDGQGVCVVGCPTDAKRSSNVSWVPRALEAGAQLLTGLPVRTISWRGDRAVGVIAAGTTPAGAPRRVEVRARAVVIAAGTLQTPLLLARSGVRGRWLGRGLSVHPALGAYARFPTRQAEPWRAVPQGVFAEGLVDPRVRFEGFYGPPQMAAPTFPQWGADLTHWMDDWARVLQFGFMVRDGNVGSVRAGPGGRPLVRYDVTPDVLHLLLRGAAALAELLLRGGAEEVETAISGVGTVRTVDEARAIGGLRLPARRLRAMAFHPLGTCRVGRDSDHGVVDAEHRVFGTSGLYVADGSSVPTSLGVNPQVTIMAMALRAAAGLTAALA
jgi:choline dehydrogenase-like flavoprotein